MVHYVVFLTRPHQNWSDYREYAFFIQYTYLPLFGFDQFILWSLIWSGPMMWLPGMFLYSIVLESFLNPQHAFPVAQSKVALPNLYWNVALFGWFFCLSILHTQKLWLSWIAVKEMIRCPYIDRKSTTEIKSVLDSLGLVRWFKFPIQQFDSCLRPLHMIQT